MKNKVVLAVGAHPDDVELFGISGTLAKFAEEGNEVYLIICTDGSRGSDDPKMTHERLAKIRKEEQEEAAKVLGIKKVFFLNHTDTQLVADLKLKADIVKIIRTVRPQTVITLDPALYYSTDSFFGFNFINHTDHRAAGLATMDAVFPLCRDRLTFPEHEKEGLKPHKVEELWLTSFNKIDHVVDISKTIDKKIKAFSMHKSQFKDFKKMEKWMRGMSSMIGGKKGYKFAENFIRLKLLP